MKKKVKIEIAEQHKTKMLGKIADIFLDKVIQHPEAMITDLSRISDFFWYPIDEALGPGTKEGTYKFSVTVYEGPKIKITDPDFFKEKKKKTNWTKKIIEVKPDPSRQEIIDRGLETFGVDISKVYDKNIGDILVFILAHMPDYYRSLYNL